MSSVHFFNLPVIYHETGDILFIRIYMLASFSVFLIYMVSGFRMKIPLNQLLLGAATFFLFFTIGSKLPAFTAGDWNLLVTHGQWPRGEKKTMLGGLAGLMAAILLYLSWTRNSQKIFDVVAIVLPVGMCIQRFSCLFYGCCFGIPTQLPWGIRYDQHSDAWTSQVISGQIKSSDLYSLPVHPTQIYDVIIWVIVFYLSARTVRYFYAPGSRLLLTIILYGIFRFFLEFLRDPRFDFISGSFGGIKYIQWMILAILPLPLLFILTMDRYTGKPGHQEVQEEEKFARHFIMVLILVFLSLLFRGIFNLQEMILLCILFTSLFILTALRVFRRDPVSGFSPGIFMLLPLFVITGFQFM